MLIFFHWHIYSLNIYSAEMLRFVNNGLLFTHLLTLNAAMGEWDVILGTIEINLL